MNRVKASVIIPVYNVEAYLPKCMDSVLAQTFGDFEVILVNDGSTDRSPAICDQYKAKDARIKVIHKANGGLSSARNAGLEIASGEYICFLDSDDYVDATLLEKTIGTMEEKACDWVGFGMIKEDFDGNLIEKIGYKPYEIRVDTQEERMEFLLKYLLNYRLGWEACNHVYRHAIIKAHQLRFTSERKVFAEDMLFAFTYWLYAESCVELDEYLYHYVQRADSLMGKSKFRNVLPQIHVWLQAAYAAVERAGLTLIQRDFEIIYFHIFEWQIRRYIAEKGVDWVRAELEKIRHDEFLPAEREQLREMYQNRMRRYGQADGIVTVVVPVLSDSDLERAQAYIDGILKQTLQKLDILLISTHEVELDNQDVRIRQIQRETLDDEGIIRHAFEEGFGEYVYFADDYTELPAYFLERLSDILKYNDCSTIIIDTENTGFIDVNDCRARRRIRKYLREIQGTPRRKMFTRELLQKSGLACMGDLKKYTEEIILSGHMIITPV